MNAKSLNWVYYATKKLGIAISGNGTEQTNMGRLIVLDPCGNDQLYREPARDQLDVSKKWGTARDGLQLLVLMVCTLFIAWLTAWTFFVFVYVQCSRIHNVWSFLALVHHLLYSMLAHIFYIMLVSFICMSICPWLIENQVQVASVRPCTSISVRNSPEVFRPANKKTVFRDISEYFAWNSNPMPERLLTGGYIHEGMGMHTIHIHTYPYIRHTFMDLPVMLQRKMYAWNPTDLDSLAKGFLHTPRTNPGIPSPVGGGWNLPLVWFKVHIFDLLKSIEIHWNPIIPVSHFSENRWIAFCSLKLGTSEHLPDHGVPEARALKDEESTQICIAGATRRTGWPFVELGGRQATLRDVRNRTAI